MPRWWASSWMTVIADLVGELVRIGEVLLEREAEQRDPVGDGDPVGGPLGPRHALVQAVQRLVRTELVLAPLVGRRVVGDDDRDLVQGGRERHRDRREGALDEHARTGGVGRGRRVRSGRPCGVWPCRPYPRVVDARTKDPDGFVVVVEPGDRIHFLDWGGSGEPGLLLIHGLSEHGLDLGARRSPDRRGTPRRRDGPARARPVRRPDRGLRRPTSSPRTSSPSPKARAC